MKKINLTLLLTLLCAFGYSQSIDSTGLEGDHLNLNGVLELFKESENVEDFEKKLNSEENGVNNLDLNGDGEVDYIRVVDHADGDAHALALQVPVNASESQDVAVIEMEQSAEEEINLQVIGDAELYGEDYLVEPVDQTNRHVTVNVYTWRPVRYMYSPRYSVWVSPWRWRSYPRWWRPWRRVRWGVYRPRVVRYHGPHYRVVRNRRCHRAHRHYTVHRVHSVTFKNNHASKHALKTSNQPKSYKTTSTKTHSGATQSKSVVTNPAKSEVKKTTSTKKNTAKNTAKAAKSSGNTTTTSTTKGQASVSKKATTQKSAHSKSAGKGKHHSQQKKYHGQQSNKRSSGKKAKGGAKKGTAKTSNRKR